MPRRRLALALTVGTVGVLGAGAGAVRAGDEPPRAAPLVTRWIEVSALTMGATSFFADRGPAVVPADQVNDEERPLFGGEGEEAWKPVGGASDLLESLKGSVGARGAWETEGVRLCAQGERWLAVTHRPDVVAKAEAYVASLERAALATYDVDVACLSGEASAVGDDGLAGAVARGALVPLRTARASGIASQRVAGRTGELSAFVQDEDVEVAEDAKIADPVVAVAPDGLAFDARVTASGARLRVDVHAWWAAHDLERARDAGETGALTLPRAETREVSATVVVDPGSWTVLPATGAGADARLFAVRVTPRAETGAARPGDGAEPAAWVRLPALGEPTPRSHDVADLATSVPNRRGPSVRLDPSNYTPPEPPEVPEPMPVFPTSDALVELVRTVVDPPSWEAEGTRLEVRSHALLACTDAPRQAAIERVLAEVRRRSIRPARLRAVVATIPASSLPELWTGLEDALVADGGAALLARPGARVSDRAALRLMTPQRDAAVGGRWVDYLGDFDVEIGTKSTIANPIVKRCFAGLSLDVRATWTLDRSSLFAEVRLDRSTLRATRDAPTPVGTIECPSLGLLRVRSTVLVPAGGTRLVAANLSGGEVTLVLLHVAGD